MPPVHGYAVHDKALGGKLEAFLRAHRDDGDSWDDISDALRDEHDLKVNARTLARWFRELQKAS